MIRGSRLVPQLEPVVGQQYADVLISLAQGYEKELAESALAYLLTAPTFHVLAVLYGVALATCAEVIAGSDPASAARATETKALMARIVEATSVADTPAGTNATAIDDEIIQTALRKMGLTDLLVDEDVL